MGVFFLLTLSPSKADIFDDVTRILQAGNIEALSPYLSPKFELELPDGTFHSRDLESTKIALQRFIKQNPPKSAAIIHRGPAGQRSFVIVHYRSSNGSLFRITIYMEGAGENKVIREMKLENS